MADKDKAKIDLGLLDEDDEFEEFPAEGKKKINIFFEVKFLCKFIHFFFRLFDRMGRHKG